MIFYLIITLPISEIIFISITNINFRINHTIDKKNIVKGGTIIYNISLINQSILVFCPMILYFEDGTTRRVILSPNTSEHIERALILKHRGSYNIGITKIEIIGFLGLFNYNYVDVEYHKVLVYPKIYQLKSLKFDLSLKDTSESIFSLNSENQSISSDLKEYYPGDSFNKIHWKISASKNKLISKILHGDKNNHFRLLFDNSELKDINRLILEDNLIESSVSISKYLLENNNKLDFEWYNSTKHLLSANKPQDFNLIYQSLSQVKFENTNIHFIQLLKEQKRIECNSGLIIFIHNLTNELLDIINLKNKQGFKIIIITPKIETVNIRNFYKLIDKGIKVYFSSFIGQYCKIGNI